MSTRVRTQASVPDAASPRVRKYLAVLTVGGILLLTLIGGGFRLWRLGEMSFWMDEAFSVQAARAIQRNGVPRYETGEMGWGWLPEHYLMAGALTVIDDPQQAARLPAAVAGTLEISVLGALAFLLTRSRTAAVLTAFLTAFSVPEIAWSRQGRGYMLLQTLGMAALTLGLIANGRTQWRYRVACCLLLALSILNHRAGYIYWLMVAGGWALDRFTAPNRRGGNPWRLVGEGGLMLLPLVAGWLLPADSSQAIGETLKGLQWQVDKPSYAAGYLSMIQDFWSWNTPWMIVGFIALLRSDWRKSAPILAGMAAYFIVISERTLWFHVRYLLPITSLLNLSAAIAPALLARSTAARHLKRGLSALAVAGLAVLWGLSTSTQNLTFVPESAYELGPTEPQADWRAAFAWLRKEDPRPTTIMALPVFHDVYLGPHVGRKYFLPFTFSRVPGDWQERAAYTEAEPVREVEQLHALNGYVILDRFSFRRLRNRAVCDLLAGQRPAFVTKDGTVRVWRLPVSDTGSSKARTELPVEAATP